MTREKKKAPAPAHGIAAAIRRAKTERAMQYSDHVWRTLNPLKAPPKMKHKSYFEAVENADKKKKKLEFEITTARDPPPGFEFIPTGHPELSQECKEQSRNRDAMFFIVSDSKNTSRLDHHMNRLGYHFRHTIVEEARKVLQQRGHHEQAAYVHEPGKPEPIPNSQREIDQEADAVLRDLFPRIPNTDRQEIINHAFKKDGMFKGEFKVGMAKDITLARRVQLAALAHIRHTHTRYDELLKESDWPNARKAVEKPCLDIIVKWRGDEETGRDQLDEILREVIEISDTESETDDESSGADNAHTRGPRAISAATLMPRQVLPQLAHVSNQPFAGDSPMGHSVLAGSHTPPRPRGFTKAERKMARKTQQRFRRYAAAAEALANTSSQNGHLESPHTPRFVATPMEVVRSQGSVNIVNPSRAASTAAVHQTFVSGTPHSHTEVQRVPVTYTNGFGRERAPGISYTPLDTYVHDSTHRFIRVPDTQRPKVGPYSANQNQPPPPPLSPVRLGLQDLLLPSIEPMSPDGSRVLQSAPQRLHHEPRQFAEVPRVISRTVVEPIMSGSRPRSPDSLANDDEVAAKRRRVTTYFPEDFQAPPNSSYIRVAHQGQDEALHRPEYKYLPDRPAMVSRVPERVLYEDSPRALPDQDIRVTRAEDGSLRSRAYPILVNGDDRSLTTSRAPDHAVYQSGLWVPSRQEHPVDRIEDGPIRSRVNPIVIDGDGSHQARRVIAMRGSPVHEIYRAISPRRGDGIHGVHVHGDPRTRDSSRVIYVDEPTDRPGNMLSSHHHGLSHAMSRPPFHPEIRPQHPDTLLQPYHRTPDHSARHVMPYDREIIRVSETEHTPVMRETRAPVPEAPHFDSYSEAQQHGLRQHSGFDLAQHQFGDNVIYQEIRSNNVVPVGTEYQPEPQQPFPVYPARSSYVEIRGPPTHQRMRNHRDMIYVE
ncbi:hypothetical protein F5Y19DRAFT_339642 [Xylariaceae sp. FL1651]|nr:hypothetical protein F5Y19DRAFT_339642 [Xylariaceae sp. FL1651]